MVTSHSRVSLGGVALLVALVACVGDSPSTNPGDSGSVNDASGADATNDASTLPDATAGDASDANVVPTWPPSNLVSSLVVWLDGDSNITVSGGKVAAWGDKTNKGNSAGEPNAALQPIVSPDTFNGHKAVQFQGCKRLQINDAASLQVGTTFTVGAVVRYAAPTGAGSSGQVFQKQPSAVPYAGVYLTTTATGQLASYVRNDQPSVYGPAGFVNKPRRAILRYNTTSLTLRVDGVETAVAVQSTDTSAVGVKVTLGAGGPTAECLSGDIAEIVFLNSSLSGSDTDALDAYFKAKYAL